MKAGAALEDAALEAAALEAAALEDGAREVRAGEQLDEAALRAYLATALGSAVSTLQIEQFPGGYSNLTYLLKLTHGEGATREIVLRRPPFGSKVKRAHDMGREHRILSALSPVLSWAPSPVAFCTDHEVLGADFYLMDRLRGVILRRSIPKQLNIDETAARRLSETLLDVLVELHDVDPAAVGLADLGKPNGYVERQVRGWGKRYDDAKTDEVPEIPAVAAWLADHLPTPQDATILHNDYKFDNVIYDAALTQTIGVLDWEMATIGDPLMDLGTVLCYWIEAGDPQGLQNLAFGPTMLPGMFTRQQLAERYAAATGRHLDEIVFYYVFGLFKTAVVCQQIYLRFTQGLTKDPRFGALNVAVKMLAEKAKAEEAVGK